MGEIICEVEAWCNIGVTSSFLNDFQKGFLFGIYVVLKEYNSGTSGRIRYLEKIKSSKTPKIVGFCVFSKS